MVNNIDRNIKLSQLEIEISLSKEMIEAAKKESYEHIQKSTKFENYPNGDAPLNFIIENTSDSKLKETMRDTLLGYAIKKALPSLDNERILGMPAYDVIKHEIDEFTVKLLYPIYPEVQICDYKNLETKFKPLDFDLKKELQREIDFVRLAHAKHVNSDLKVVTSECVPYINMKSDSKKYGIEEKELVDTPIIMGARDYFIDFEKQLVGLKLGETKEIKVTFPKEHAVPILRDQDIKYTVTINSIKEKVLPEYNDAFIKQLNINGLKTVKEFEESISESLRLKNIQLSKNKYQVKAFEEIRTKTKIPLSPDLIESTTAKQVSEFTGQLAKNGNNLEKWLKHTNNDLENFINESRSNTYKKITESWIFNEIATLEKIKATEEEIENEAKLISKTYNKSVDEVKKLITKHAVEIAVTNKKVIDRLIELNK